MFAAALVNIGHRISRAALDEVVDVSALPDVPQPLTTQRRQQWPKYHILSIPLSAVQVDIGF